MKKHGIHLLTAVILVCSTLIACNSNSDKYDNEEDRRKIAELEKITGAKFPPGSKIVYATSDERNKEASSQYIIYSPTPAEFNQPPNGRLSSVTFIEILEASATKDIGKPKDKWTTPYEGTVGKGDWRAFQTNFESGSYLQVDQVFLN